MTGYLPENLGAAETALVAWAKATQPDAFVVWGENDGPFPRPTVHLRPLTGPVDLGRAEHYGRTFEVTVDEATEGEDYEVTTAGATYSYTAIEDDTEALIATALAALIQAGPNVSAVATGAVIVLTPDAADTDAAPVVTDNMTAKLRRRTFVPQDWTISVNVMTDDDSAEARAMTLRGSMHAEDLSDALQVVGLAPKEASPTRNISGVGQGKAERRRQFDATFRVHHRQTRPVDWIETVSISKAS